MALKTKTKLIECKHTLAGLQEAMALPPDAQGQKRYKVVLLSEGKGNPRDKHFYSQACIDDPITSSAFEGKPCFLNHPSLIDDQSQPERRVQDKGGWFSEVHADGPALWATLTINKRPAGELLECIIQDCMEYSKKFPGQDYDGLSINANGESSQVEMDGETWNQVDRITEAESVDAVTKAARGGRFVAKLEALRKKEVDVEAPKKLKQLGEIIKAMRDKIQAGDKFPLQAELRRMADNGLTLAGCGEIEEEPMITEAQYQTMKKATELYEAAKAKNPAREGASADNKIARKHTHDTLKGMAAQVPDDATKQLLMAHADKYKDEDAADGGADDGKEEAGSSMPGQMPDTSESEKKTKEEKMKKEEREKKEKMSKEEKDKEEKDAKEEKMEAYRKELFDLKLENKLAESGLPEQTWKMIRSLSRGKTIEEVDEIIEAQQEIQEFSLRESSLPARVGGSGNSSDKPMLGAFANV